MKTPRVAVVTLVRHPEYHHRLLILKKKTNNKWEFPGGKLELGETTVEGALRELSEEAGINNVFPIQHQFCFEQVDPQDHWVNFVYAVKAQSACFKISEVDKFSTATWASIHDLYNKYELTDGAKELLDYYLNNF